MTITIENNDFAVIREEQCSPALSTVMKNQHEDTNIGGGGNEEALKLSPNNDMCCACQCDPLLTGGKFDQSEVDKLLEKKELELCEQFEAKMKKEIQSLSAKFDFILRNEQIRASYMLTAAYRERQEKIAALQTQLECKNLAGMMFVLCSERRRSKLEKFRIIEDYTNYINALTDILSDGQNVILDLSRGYKTAARVDHEWREKMKSVLCEFQAFVQHFGGGTPETNQYFLNMPKLLKTKTSIVDNPDEDPICTCEENEYITEAVREKEWWEQLDDQHRPFVVYGDMADFKPPQRREVLKNVKATKTAPKRWKDYVFNTMRLEVTCPNVDQIKYEYEQHVPTPLPWECSQRAIERENSGKDSLFANCSRRVTTASVDVRGMGSIFKIIGQCGANSEPVTKATLLGARDSMEITSTTKLREKSKQATNANVSVKYADCNDKIDVTRNRRTSFFEDAKYLESYDELEDDGEQLQMPSAHCEKLPYDTSSTMAHTKLAEAHTDSLEIIDQHVPDKDAKLHYERVCPVDKCKRMHMDSFIRSLPEYMKTGPFTHFQSTFEKYEACTPEQLEILQKRIEERKRDKLDPVKINTPEAEWASVEGLGCQTSQTSMFDMPPPCTCRDPNVSPASSAGQVFALSDLLPVKHNLNEIAKSCFYDPDIQFNRFKIIGQESECSDDKPSEPARTKEDPTNPFFTTRRLDEIRKLLKIHPSLCDLFQNNM